MGLATKRANNRLIMYKNGKNTPPELGVAHKSEEEKTARIPYHQSESIIILHSFSI
jgi:hypothetical protein